MEEKLSKIQKLQLEILEKLRGFTYQESKYVLKGIKNSLKNYAVIH